MPDENTQSETKTVALWTPVVIIAATILGSILLMIGAAVLNLDYGRVLGRMSEVGFARGLITYLFAVATIGTAVVLIVYALSPNRDDGAFGHGKEILALLLGVFGTIVGFYFGREAVAAVEDTLMVAPLKVSTTAATAGQTIHVTTVTSGGKAPLRFGIVFGDQTPKFDASPAPGGWIDKDVIVPSNQQAGQVAVKVVVDDSDRHEVQESQTITIGTGNNK
jgi:hypothetical protein